MGAVPGKARNRYFVIHHADRHSAAARGCGQYQDPDSRRRPPPLQRRLGRHLQGPGRNWIDLRLLMDSVSSGPIRCALTERTNSFAANSAPETNPTSGPKLQAAGLPRKCSPGIEDSSPRSEPDNHLQSCSCLNNAAERIDSARYPHEILLPEARDRQAARCRRQASSEVDYRLRWRTSPSPKRNGYISQSGSQPTCYGRSNCSVGSWILKPGETSGIDAALPPDG